MALLTYNEQQAIKAISANNQSKYAQIETETEETDLKDLLGIQLLQDIQTSPATTWNAKLLAGDTYTDSAGNTITIKGVKWMLAYMVYSRYIEVSFVADTFTGFVQKTHSEANSLTEGNFRKIVERNREIALKEWDYIKGYLDYNYLNFPKWLYDKKINPYIPKFTGLKRTIL